MTAMTATLLIWPNKETQHQHVTLAEKVSTVKCMAFAGIFGSLTFLSLTFGRVCVNKLQYGFEPCSFYQ